MTLPVFQHAHLIGIGGIQVSAMAKLLLSTGVSVSGSDLVRSEITDELVRRGVLVAIGHAAENVPTETEIVIYSSAVQEMHPERAEARRRGIPQMNSHAFLGEWVEGKKVYLVTGTHGKSTTTALLGLMLHEAGKDPNVVVGSRVPKFPDGNALISESDMFVIEGDEFDRHFLAFSSNGIILNNLELDHVDHYPDVESLHRVFRQLLMQVQRNGIVVANADDPHVSTLIGLERSHLEQRSIRILTFGFGSHADVQIMDHVTREMSTLFVVRDAEGVTHRMISHLPGKMNVMNAVAAMTLARVLGASTEIAQRTLLSFFGIWRRFEKVAESNGVTVISDYAHHPTAMRMTLEAAKQWFPGRRIVLCFQPHQQHRTKSLFQDFVPAFDRADALVLAEIYDVAGRENARDQTVTSLDLARAVKQHDADRSSSRHVEYAQNPEQALQLLRAWETKGDVMIVMGAGDIYRIADRIIV